MTHKEAPPLTPEQERFEKFWLELKGPGYTGFGRGKDGGYLSEFSRDAYRAWEEASAPSKFKAKIDGLIRVGDKLPRLFVTTPCGIRKELRRVEYMDSKKYPAWTSSIGETKEA